MTLNEIIPLIGLKSTDVNLKAWFEQYQLSKPPKTVNVNQDVKDVDDKQHELTYEFTFNIINDQFYPPTSPKNDNYTFDCYLKSVSVFQRKMKGNIEKPHAFWDNYIHPDSSYEECCAFFGSEGEQSEYDVFFSKMLNDTVEMCLWMTPDKSQVRAIELNIPESVEFLSVYDFDEQNEYNTIHQAYLLVVKWLFDQRYLLLPDEVYAKGLSFDNEEIKAFVSEYLRNHIWANQLNLSKEPDLYQFLFNVCHNIHDKLKNDENLDAYVKHLFLKQAGIWEEHQRIYHETYDTKQLERSVFLDQEQSQSLVNQLAHLFEYYKIHKK